jgi:hypothetical protein
MPVHGEGRVLGHVARRFGTSWRVAETGDGEKMPDSRQRDRPFLMTPFKTTRRTLLQLMAGLSVFRAARSGAADTFTLVPTFTPGQVLRYRQDLHLVGNGGIGHRSRSTVTVEIRQRIANGWLARWTTSGSKVLEADPGMRPLLEAMWTLWDDAAIDLLLDEGGRVTGLADPAAMQAHGARSLDSLVTLLVTDPGRAHLAQPLRNAMQPMLADGAVLTQSLLKEPAILLGAMGHDYRVGEPLEVRTRIPSPMGTGAIPMLGRYQVRGISTRDSCADIGWLMVVDRASMASTVGVEVTDLARRIEAGSHAPADDPTASVAESVLSGAAAGLDLDDRADFIVDTTSAWPVSVRHVRHTSATGGSRVDTVALTRLDA